MARHRITLTVPHNSPGTLFMTPKISVKFERGQPPWAGSIDRQRRAPRGVLIVGVATELTSDT